MSLLDFLNSILQLIGEPRLSSSNGTLGTTVKNAAQSAILMIATTLRPQQFELLVSATQPIETLPGTILQIYSCFLEQNNNFKKIPFLPLEQLNHHIGYSLVGNTLYVSNKIEQPFLIRLHALTCPTLPASDDADIGISPLFVPAIQHLAASILLTSYLDDTALSSAHRNMADALIAQLRGTTGTTRGRSFNLGL
jgi:hypothetical protein